MTRRKRNHSREDKQDFIVMLDCTLITRELLLRYLFVLLAHIGTWLGWLGWVSPLWAERPQENNNDDDTSSSNNSNSMCFSFV